MADEYVHVGSRNHLLIAPDVVVRGTVFPCFGRLSDHLRHHEDPVITVRDAEVRHLQLGTSEEADEVRMRIDLIALAHEYVDLGGDAHLKSVHAATIDAPLRLTFAAIPGLLLAGRTRVDVLGRRERFFTVNDPTCVVEPEGLGYGPVISDLPYVLANRDAVSALVLPQGLPDEREGES